MKPRKRRKWKLYIENHWYPSPFINGPPCWEPSSFPTAECRSRPTLDFFAKVDPTLRRGSKYDWCICPFLGVHSLFWEKNWVCFLILHTCLHLYLAIFQNVPKIQNALHWGGVGRTGTRHFIWHGTPKRGKMSARFYLTFPKILFRHFPAYARHVGGPPKSIFWRKKIWHPCVIYRWKIEGKIDTLAKKSSKNIFWRIYACFSIDGADVSIFQVCICQQNMESLQYLYLKIVDIY